MYRRQFRHYRIMVAQANLLVSHGIKTDKNGALELNKFAMDYIPTTKKRSKFVWLLGKRFMVMLYDTIELITHSHDTIARCHETPTAK